MKERASNQQQSKEVVEEEEKETKEEEERAGRKELILLEGIYVHLLTDDFRCFMYTLQIICVI